MIRLLVDAERRKLGETRGRALQLLRQLELLNPAAVMRKGYAIPMAEGRVLTTVKGLSPGQELVTLVADGEIVSTVRSWKENGEGTT